MRLVAIIGLLLSLVVLGTSALESWQPIAIPATPEVSEKKRTPPVAERQNIAFNPQVPVLMPDLNTGYLFNPQRSFAEEEGEEPASDEVLAGAASQLNMETLFYVGSIIVGDLRKGMVSFSMQEERATSPLPGRRGRTIARRRVPAKTSMEYATVDEGEDFYGYKVVSVQPDRIVFSKNGKNVEKLLYDPDKERPEPVALNRPSPAVPANRGADAQQPERTVPQPASGTRQAVTPNPAMPATPAVQAPRPRNNIPQRTVQRPRVIQRRRLPVQTR